MKKSEWKGQQTQRRRKKHQYNMQQIKGAK